MMRRCVMIAVLLALSSAARAADVPPAPAPPQARPEISDVQIYGAIQEENITFVLEFTAKLPKDLRVLPLVSGDLAVEKVEGVTGAYRLLCEPAPRLDAPAGKGAPAPPADSYSLWLAQSGPHRIKLTFSARPLKVQGGEWRECAFTVPLSEKRELRVTSDRPDLDIVFPNAMRVTRDVKDNTLTTTAVLGVGRTFAVRWKPQVQELAGKLVAAAEVNAIASVSAGAVRVDAVILYSISQGEAREFKVAIPKSLGITQVRGAQIQDWSTELRDGSQILTATLTQPQKQDYILQVQGEAPLREFPAEVDLPVIEPLGTIRASGTVCVGTDSAVHIKMQKSAGLTQIDTAAFPLVAPDREHPRPLPARSTFCYRHAAALYQLSFTASDIRPSVDASQQLVATVRDDDLVLRAAITLDVRDAPIREVTFSVPKGFTVAEVSGDAVVPNGHELLTGAAGTLSVRVPFREPVIGQTIVQVRLEIGASPLESSDRRVPVPLAALNVAGAKSERGYLVLAADPGIEIKAANAAKLSEVNTGSLQVRVPQAQKAYRFREPGWSLELHARQNPPSIRCEMFHLVSIGEGIAYGSTTVTLLITGSPIDKLRFRIPKTLANVEFIGREVQGQKQEGDVWTITFRRRIVQFYTLLITASQRFDPAHDTILVGGIECPDADTEVGYAAVSSVLTLNLAEKENHPGASLIPIIPIAVEELPASYADPINAPVLKAYKYVKPPTAKAPAVKPYQAIELTVKPYQTERLLDVVIDPMELSTSISEKGDAMTTATYEIKNASGQFLELAMPKGSLVWPIRQIDMSARNPVPTHVIASRNSEGNLLIPLIRHRDPKSAIRLTVQYGETGIRELGFGRRFQLVAPQTKVPSTFARWTVDIPKDFTFSNVESSMAGETPPAEQPGLAAVGESIVERYRRTADRLPWSAGILYGVLAVIALAAVGLKRPEWLGRTLILLVALGWMVFAIAAAGRATPGIARTAAAATQQHQLVFTQAISLSKTPGEPKPPLEISASVAPWWAAGILTARTIGLLAAAAVLAVASVLARKMRKLLLALAVAALLCAVAVLPIARAPLEIALLWVAPFLPLLLLGIRWALPPRRVAEAIAALVLLFLLPVGCVSKPIVLPPPPGTAMDSAEFFLKVEKDSVEVTEHLRFRTAGPAVMPILWGPAALIDAPKDARIATELTEGGCQLRVREAGEHDATVRFLLPLEKASADEVRRFGLRIPRAIVASAQLTIPQVNLQVASPSAVKLEKKEDGKSTVIDTRLGPGSELSFVWAPRARQTKLEKTTFFADVLSSVRFRPGVVECIHVLHFQVAQGELRDLKITVPEGMAVTSVDGEHLGAWRYDPAARSVEIRLVQPVTGEYSLLLITQVTQQDLPYTVTVGVPAVEGAASQRGAIGLHPAPDVQIEVKQSPPEMNAEDYGREIRALLAAPSAGALGAPRYAYRYTAPGAAVTAVVQRVVPEVRSDEAAAFSVRDDRLVYNGLINVTVTKAGLFSVALRIPSGYDIDSLTSPDVSHWDEDRQPDGSSLITVHFTRQLLGAAPLRVALTRSISELPPQVSVPRIDVVDSLKHTGQIVVSSEPGVRLSIKDRSGVSHEKGDINTDKDALVFKLLKPDWTLILAADKIEPRTEVQFLHVANVSEGLVDGVTYLRYTMHNAGVKVLRIQVPGNLTGLEISGNAIAKTHEVKEGSGTWEVELASKVQTYFMIVRYEQRFDKDRATIRPVRDLSTDLQRGYIVVRTHEKVEVSPVQPVDSALKPADARTIPSDLGERDLSDAALCYHSSNAAAAVEIEARRHDDAHVLGATVSSVGITTIVSEEGDQLSKVRMQINVGSLRELRVTLPQHARLWSLFANNAPVTPSLAAGTAKAPIPPGYSVLLIPLGQGAADSQTTLEFTYVTPRPPSGSSLPTNYEGPRFDLPLSDVRWTFYVPESMKYSRFGGTLEPDKENRYWNTVARYDPAARRSRIQSENNKNVELARQQFKKSQQLADAGRIREAKQAAQEAYNNSFSQSDLNEDARVQLQKWQRQQTMTGLLNRRDNVRPRQGLGLLEPRGQANQAPDLTPQAAQQMQSSLGQEESTSLQTISDRTADQQEAARRSNWALSIDMIERGRTLLFDRDLQINPDAPMNVSFAAAVPLTHRTVTDYAWAAGIAVLVLFGLAFARRKEDQEESVQEERPAPSDP